MYIGNKLVSTGSTPTSIDTLGMLLEGEGYHLRYASEESNPFLRLADMLLSVWRFRHYDCLLIDTYSTKAFMYAWLVARMASMLKLRYIPILHGGNLPQRFVRSPKMSRQIFSNSWVNAAVSPYLEQHLQANKYRSVLIPNSIDLKQYPYTARRVFKPNLLWVRAFHSIYNPQMAVRLIAMLSGTYPDARITMIGPDNDGSLVDCKKLAAELGVADRVKFTGKLTKQEWIKLSREHDVFLNTTRFDNLPVSLIEAMALGLPIVSTNVGGIPFLINDGATGLLVADNDIDAMYSGVERLLSDPKLGMDITSKARTQAEQFDWAHIRHEWFNILDQA